MMCINKTTNEIVCYQKEWFGWVASYYGKFITLQQKGSEYDHEIPHSHTADQPTALRGSATEHPQQKHIRKTIIAKQLAFSSSSRWLQN